MTEETAAKRDTQRLQRAIIDGLEDVKAQDIAVFNTEHLSPLFERVIVASGTSNRQTKALASSVRDAVREAGFPKPRIEGEENGEWIIVDCGAAVVHVMQPAIRTYYHLEEIWGEKPVRLKFGAAKPAQASEDASAKKPAAKKAGKTAAKTAGKTQPKATAKAAGKKPKKIDPRTQLTSNPASDPMNDPRIPGNAAAKAAPAKKASGKPPAKSPAKTASKAPAKAPAKRAASKSPSRGK